MVLNDATASPNSTGDSFPSDSSPTSDYDPYSSSSDSSNSSSLGPSGVFPEGYVLDQNRLPKPIPLVGAYFGFGASRRRQAIIAACTTISKTIQRPLTAEECDSIAYHMSKGATISSYGEPAGLLAGYWRYNNTRATFQFPFYKPDLEKLNRDKLFFLRGGRARVGWDILRLLAYGGLAGFIGQAGAGAYAASVVAVGQATDPRMRNVKESISKMSDDEVRRRGGIGGRGPMNRGWRDPPPYQQQQGQEQQMEQGYGGIQPQGDVDDASAQSSGFGFDDASPTASAPTQNTGSAWDQIRKTGGGRPQVPQKQTASEPKPGRPPGDAWANRRGRDLNSGQTSGGVQQEQRTGSTMGDSYAFSGSEAERAEAKAQSQREFDEKIDRERQGRNFDDSAGGKWR